MEHKARPPISSNVYFDAVASLQQTLQKKGFFIESFAFQETLESLPKAERITREITTVFLYWLTNPENIPVRDVNSHEIKRYLAIPSKIRLITAKEKEQAVIEESGKAYGLRETDMFSDAVMDTISSDEDRRKMDDAMLSPGFVFRPPQANDATSILVMRPGEHIYEGSEKVITENEFGSTLIQGLMNAAMPLKDIFTLIQNEAKRNPKKYTSDYQQSIVNLYLNYCRILFLEKYYPQYIREDEPNIIEKLHKLYDHENANIFSIIFRGLNINGEPRIGLT